MNLHFLVRHLVVKVVVDGHKNGRAVHVVEITCVEDVISFGGTRVDFVHKRVLHEVSTFVGRAAAKPPGSDGSRERRICSINLEQVKINFKIA
jgi:hypothetical protein